MKFDTGDNPPVRGPVEVGNVYRAKGGRGPNSPEFWIVVAVRDRRCCVIGILGCGIVVSAQTYGAHAFEERTKVGFVEGVRGVVLDVSWCPGEEP